MNFGSSPYTYSELAMKHFAFGLMQTLDLSNQTRGAIQQTCDADTIKVTPGKRYNEPNTLQAARASRMYAKHMAPLWKENRTDHRMERKKPFVTCAQNGSRVGVHTSGNAYHDSGS